MFAHHRLSTFSWFRENTSVWRDETLEKWNAGPSLGLDMQLWLGYSKPSLLKASILIALRLLLLVGTICSLPEATAGSRKMRSPNLRFETTSESVILWHNQDYFQAHLDCNSSVPWQRHWWLIPAEAKLSEAQLYRAATHDEIRRLFLTNACTRQKTRRATQLFKPIPQLRWF